MKALVTLLVIFLSIVGVVAPILADCHDEENGETSCEDMSRLISSNYWSRSNHNEIDFWINTTSHPSEPALAVDVRNSARTWSTARHNGHNISFSLDYEDTTLQQPGNATDGVNTVGWDRLAWTNLEKVYGTTFKTTYRNSNQLKDVDIGINYYAPFDRHDYVSSNEVCIREVMAHEWGHFAGLGHITTAQASADDCGAIYIRYTMWAHMSGLQPHARESLECEDKYALYYIYGTH